ncbi:polymorphic toxin-type HINT domain-containing protein [Kitasatospora sp. NPDC004240]
MALIGGLLSAAPVAADEPPPGGLGATDRGKIVEFWKSGGPAVKAAAEIALMGSEQDVRRFLESGRAAAEYQDDREAALQIVAQGGTGLREAAEKALAGSVGDLDTFLKEGWQTPLQQDKAVEATRITDAGGPGVRQAGDAALHGTPEQLDAFLNREQFTQRETDDLVRVTQIESSGGEATKRATNPVMHGTAEDVREFLTVGQYIARAQDQETASITQLTEQVKAAGLRAEQEAAAATEAGDRAVSAARLAKEAAAVAAAESAGALNDTARAAEASRRAAEAARRAVDAAKAAVAASRSANSVARAAAHAAAEASAAAVNADQATARVLKAAAEGKADEEGIKYALFSAQLATSTAQAADRARRAASSVIRVNELATEIVTNVNAAIDSADASGRSAVQAGLSALETSAASGAARRYSQESARAAKVSTALAAEAGLAAGQARDAANSAAARAKAAAEAASKAASHAGDAAQATEQARVHSEAAQAAASAATAGVDKAKSVYDLARKSEAEDVAARTNAGRNHAQDLSADYEAAQAASAKALSEAKKLDEDFNTLASQAAQPGADPAQIVPAGRRMAITAMKAGGPWSRTAAEYALAGADQAMLDYARTGWQSAQQQDDADRARQLAASSPYESVRTAATTALQGDPAGLHAFVENGQHETATTDYLVEVTRIGQIGGPGVKEASNAAIRAATTQALVDFLTVTQYRARETDDRVTAASLSHNGGPEMRAAAEAALVSPANILHAFVEAGQYRALRQDQLNAVHIAQVQQAIAEADDVAAKARYNAALATQAYATARAAKDEADGYAEQARQAADQAKAAASQAQSYAQQAKQSADQATASAKTADSARRKAAASADSAAASAISAHASATAAYNSAAQGYAAATAARQSAERAGADAQTLKQVFDKALGEYKAERELYDDYMWRQQVSAAWDAYFYNNLPPVQKTLVYFARLPLKQKLDFTLDLVHLTFDIFGSLPATSVPFSLANCGLYIMEGQLTGEADKYKDAALSCASTIPIGGWATLGARLEKWGVKTGKLGTSLQNLWRRQDDLRMRPSCPNSFPPGTLVRMGDGTSRPIEKIAVGDQVLAADPLTGERGPRAVEATIYTPDDRAFTDLTVTEPDGKQSTVAATDHHPFWVHNTQQWTDAVDVRPGDTLLTDTGATAQVASIRHWTGLEPAHNLTVTGLHTYFVLFGETGVLVHNDECLTLAADVVNQTLKDLPTWSRQAPTTWGRIFFRGSSGTMVPIGTNDRQGWWKSGTDEEFTGPITEFLKKFPDQNFGDNMHPASTHAETKLAWRMARKKTEQYAEIVINNPKGPCGYDAVTDGFNGKEPNSCFIVIPYILYKGSVLKVWWRDKSGIMRFKELVGQRPPEDV